MLSSQLFWRIFAVYALLTTCAAVAFAAIVVASHQQIVFDQLRSRLRDHAGMVLTLTRQSTESGPLIDRLAAVRLHSSMPGIADDPASRVEILDSTGQLLRGAAADEPAAEKDGPGSNADPRGPAAASPGSKPVESSAKSNPAAGKPSSEPGLAEAAEKGESFAIVVDPVTNQRQLQYLLRFGAIDRPDGFIKVVLNLRQVDQALSRVHFRIWGAAFTVSMLALAITYLVVGRIIWPLETLTEAAEQLTAGQLPSEVRVKTGNEIGTLAAAFNSMSRQLSARISDLQTQSVQLEENAEQLATVLRAMVEGVIAVDDQERVILANDAAIRLLELSPRNLVHRPIWEAVRQQQIQEAVRAVLAGEEMRRSEFVVPRTQNVVAMVASRLPTEAAPGAVVVLHDVTDLRRLESLRREFVANVSHELKTPLSAIAAYSETLLDGAAEEPVTCRRFVERISEQADRLHRLILDLLELARVESTESQLELSPIDATSLIRSSAEDHRRVAESKRLILEIQEPMPELWVLADDAGVRTIIDNLLGNAVNYTPPGGKVTVRGRHDGDWVLLEFEDTGVGIAREHQARIFERFYRIDKARSREVGGTGLGLSIVKHLCQLFGGTVKLSSQLGHGSTFAVRLQRAR